MSPPYCVLRVYAGTPLHLAFCRWRLQNLDINTLPSPVEASRTNGVSDTCSIIAGAARRQIPHFFPIVLRGAGAVGPKLLRDTWGEVRNSRINQRNIGTTEVRATQGTV